MVRETLPFFRHQHTSSTRASMDKAQAMKLAEAHCPNPTFLRPLFAPGSLSCSYCSMPARDRDSSPGVICTGTTLHMVHKHREPVGKMPLIWSLYNFVQSSGPTEFLLLQTPSF